MELGDRIVKKSGELFFRYGLKGVKMDDIAKELGISKKTLYQVYENKSELVMAITRKYLVIQKEEHYRAIEGAENAIAELLKLLKHMDDVFLSINPILIFEMRRYYPQAWKLFEAHKQDFMAAGIKDNLRRGIEEGLYRNNLDVNIITLFRLEQIMAALNPLPSSMDQYDLRTIQKELLAQYLYGISSLKGHRLINQYFDVKE